MSATTADVYAGEGWTAVVQDVVLGEELATYDSLVRTRPLYVVVLAPEPQAVVEREAGRSKSSYGAGWTVKALDRVLREETIGLRLDTTGQSVEQTVDAVLAGLGGLAWTVPSHRVEAGRGQLAGHEGRFRR
ncbi:hypothetical protein [Streptomyces sp. NPDC056308]|uniref:hypothetical protein n=1 Tax=Streptomyces sp. NPDC056308 TaxID=3345780 RepID=UPI0035D62E70